MGTIKELYKELNKYNFDSKELTKSKDFLKKNLDGENEHIDKAAFKVLQDLPLKIWEELRANIKQITSIDIEEINIKKIIQIKESLKNNKSESHILNSLDLLSNFIGKNTKTSFDKFLSDNIYKILEHHTRNENRGEIFDYFLNEIVGFVDGLIELEDIYKTKEGIKIKEYAKDKDLEHILREFFDANVRFNNFLNCLKDNNISSIFEINIRIDNKFLRAKFIHKLSIVEGIDQHIKGFFIDLLRSGYKENDINDSLNNFIFEHFYLAKNFKYNGQIKFTPEQIFSAIFLKMHQYQINFNPRVMMEYLDYVGVENGDLFLKIYIIFYQPKDRVGFYLADNIDQPTRKRLAGSNITEQDIIDIQEVFKANNIEIVKTIITDESRIYFKGPELLGTDRLHFIDVNRQNIFIHKSVQKDDIEEGEEIIYRGPAIRKNFKSIVEATKIKNRLKYDAIPGSIIFLFLISGITLICKYAEFKSQKEYFTQEERDRNSGLLAGGMSSLVGVFMVFMLSCIFRCRRYEGEIGGEFEELDREIFAYKTLQPNQYSIEANRITILTHDNVTARVANLIASNSAYTREL